MAPDQPHAPGEPPDDAALVRAIQSGDASAWEPVLARHQDRLFATCLRMIGDRETASDLVQDSFVRIIQGIDSFDGRARLSTWMTRVTMNVCLSHLRKEKLRRHPSLDAPARPIAGRDPDGSSGSIGAGLEQSRELGTDERVEVEEHRTRVLQALALLPPPVRAVLVLRDVQGMDYEQIASVLGVAVGTVKSRLFRARVALREAMERQGNRPNDGPTD